MVINGVEVEGDLVPFVMTKEEKRLAVERLAGGPSWQTAEYDKVQLFRAKLRKPDPVPAAAEPVGPRTRTCSSCGSTVKLPRLKRRKPLRALPKQKWWLYYGPGHMTGGFPTKEAARNWYLRGGR